MMKTGGILKKAKHHVVTEAVELLVFGYQSKLYRDDTKAIEFDRETHLIPAPYDNNLTISRYDVRATLDIAPPEVDNIYLNRLDCLSPAEQQAETMAEKERYYSLYINEVEEEIYKEEQLKRQNSEYNQIAFNYDEMGPKESSAMPEEQEEEVDSTPFVSKFELPSEIEAPKTLKAHQIIEKTAKFIASQGPQMEILLKTKQSNNPQFNFLTHDGQYNSYYKHILSLMKAGTYQYDESVDKIDETSQESNETNGKVEEPEPSTSSIVVIPKIAFKPSADCAYTQLISKITKAPISVLEQQQKQQESNSNNGHSTIKSSGLLGLASYCSDSENSDNESESESYSGPTPPTELQIVIDKTALYVAKNGYEFEETLKKKNDSRFPFLNPTDEFHAYYSFKVRENRKTFPSIPTKTTSSTATSSIEIKKPSENVETSIKTKNPPAPVSFSIKSKDDKTQLISKPLDETIEISNKSQSPKDISVEEELEMQVDALNAEKLAKEKLTEKLFTAARKNLGMSKEKILQMERKKKALMFVNQIKGSSNANGNGSNSKSEVINLTGCNDDSDDSVKSIPVGTTSTSSTTSLRVKNSSRSRSRKRSSRSSSSSSSSRSRSRSYSSNSSSETSSRSKKRKRSKSHRRKKSKYSRKSRSRSRSRSRSYSSRRSKKSNDRRHRRR